MATIIGTAGNDSLVGSAGGDTIDGYYGNDTILGGGGADSLVGGSGNDTYRFGENWGDDTITDADALGNIVFENVSESNLNFTDLNGDLVITNGANRIIVQGYYTNSHTYDFSFENVLPPPDGTILQPIIEAAIRLAVNAYPDSSGNPLLDGWQVAEGGSFASVSDFSFGRQVKILGFVTSIADVFIGNLNGETTLALAFSGTDESGLELALQTGNWHLYVDAHSDLINAVLHEAAINPAIERVLITGHSLGGILGEYCYAEYFQNDPDVGSRTDVYTFGSPGSSQSANGNIFNIVHTDDLVPLFEWAPGLSREGQDIFIERPEANIPTTAEHDRDLYSASIENLLAQLHDSQLPVEVRDQPLETLALTFAFGIGRDDIGDDLAIDAPGALRDIVFGLGGNDTLSGGSNSDVLSGGAGNDTLDGGGSGDWMIGGDGNDTLNGGTGADSMTGGAGDDIYVIDSASDQTVEAANEGTDTVQSSVTRTLDSNVENLTLTGTAVINGTGNALANVLTGNSAANVMNGSGGNDTLDGGIGSDSLAGGSGADRLIGGLGNDTLTAGGGADRFVFSGNNGTDRISDFVNGTDKIEIAGYGAALDAFADLNISVVAGNTQINLSADVAGAGMIVVAGVTGGIDTTDFLFG